MKRIAIILIALALILGGVLIYTFINKPVSDSGTNKVNQNQVTSEVNNQPFIDSIFPDSGSVGIPITLKGKNLNGPDGWTDIWITNSRGKSGVFSVKNTLNSNLLNFRFPEKVCVKKANLSESPCPGYLEVIPGTYEIYVTAFGLRSNLVTFTIVGPSETNSFFLSPQEGSRLIIGKSFSVKLASNILKDYHPLAHLFTLVDEKGREIGALCPDAAIKNDSQFEWRAGFVMSSCAGTGNFEIRVKPGNYRIVFVLLDGNGNQKMKETSGKFSLVEF